MLTLERLGHVALITLRRPEKLNALSRALMVEFHAAVEEVAADPDGIRALVLTGEGRGFCSGADVTGWGGAPPVGETVDDDPGPVSRMVIRLRRIPQPVIVAVNGIAAGGGLGLALASDIRIASEQAQFSCIFVKRSLVPDSAASYTLTKLVGHGIAAEMTLTGNRYDAEFAQRVGLVNRVVPADQLMDTAMEIANDISANPPLTVRAIKQLLSSWYKDPETVMPLEVAANAPSIGSEDGVESVQAFLEKRTPVYKGR